MINERMRELAGVTLSEDSSNKELEGYLLADVLKKYIKFLEKEFKTKLKVQKQNKDYATITLARDNLPTEEQFAILQKIVDFVTKATAARELYGEISGVTDGNGRAQPFFEIGLDLIL